MNCARALPRFASSAVLGLALFATAMPASAQPASAGARLRVAVVVAGEASGAQRALALAVEQALDGDARVAQRLEVGVRAALRGEFDPEPADALFDVCAMRAMIVGTPSDAPTLAAIGDRLGAELLVVVRANGAGSELAVFYVRRRVFAEATLSASEAVGAAVPAFVLANAPNIDASDAESMESLLGQPVPEAPAASIPPPPPATWVAAGSASGGYDSAGAPRRERVTGAQALEVLGGMLGYTVGLAPLLVATSGGDDSTWPVIIVTVPLGITLGIWLAGMASGGNGSFAWTLLGQALGGLCSVPFAFYALFNSDGPATVLALVAVLSFPIIGGVLAYEMSNDVPSSGTARAAHRSSISLRVGAAPLPGDGASLALLGTF